MSSPIHWLCYSITYYECLTQIPKTFGVLGLAVNGMGTPLYTLAGTFQTFSTLYNQLLYPLLEAAHPCQ